MNLPPLTPPSSQSSSTADPTLSAGGNPPVDPNVDPLASVPAEPSLSLAPDANLPEPLGPTAPVEPLSPPVPTVEPSLSVTPSFLPQVSEPQIGPAVSSYSSPTELQPVAESPVTSSPVPESPAEQTFTPSSPILNSLQGMPSQPFQDPNAGAFGATSTQATSPDSRVPQEAMGGGLSAASAISSEPPLANQTAAAPLASGEAPVKKGVALPKLPKGKGLIALIVASVLIVVGIAAALFFFTRSSSNSPTGNAPATRTKITYWGLWEPSEVMEPLLQQYESLNPGIDIVYTQQNRQQYRARMQTAVRGSSGPDIFRYHNTWIPMIKDDLANAPRAVLPATEIQQSFYPIMAEELAANNQVIGVPLMFEGMALLYNESMLEAANTVPPRDWREVRELAARLAIRTSDNQGLDRGGIALGTAENVDNSSDILALMMLQNSATPGNPMSPNAQTALEFYTLFSRSDGVWNGDMPQSTVAFANEEVAMILVPSWRIHEIQRLNPNLRFGVTRLPQLSDERITWASYWVEGVSKNSKNTAESWKFLAWLSEPEQLRRLYSEAVKYRGFGELYPRVEMASELADDPLVQPYLEDALYAKSWPLASMTHDEGINDQLIQYYTDAINQMNRIGNAESALEDVFPGIQQVLSRYGFTVTAPPTN